MPRKGQLTGVFTRCENCGKEIYKTPYQYKTKEHHFCNNKCQKEYIHKQTYEDRPCEICGNLMHVSKKSKQRFCCDRCQNEWQKTRVGDLNPRTTRSKGVCEVCGADIEIHEWRKKKYKHYFCSDTCRQKWYSDVFSQDEEWIDISRKRAVKILESGVMSTNTKPQIIINNLLDKLNIKYRNEENFTYYSMDNYLYEHNLIIEVMGDFWHASPIKYNVNKLHEIQKRRIIKDKAKHTYTLNNHNIEILYLWEDDINNNIDLCEKLILKYINNNGYLNNYHSFNYNIDNNDICLNDNIIIPFQDIKAA